MKNSNIQIFVFIFLIGVFTSNAQTAFTPKLIPPAPNASTLTKYGDIPVGYYNGLINKNIELYKINEKGIMIPISVSYHSSGIKVAEEAGVVGLGWALNFGGLISKTIVGEDDFESNKYFLAGTANNIPISPTYRPVNNDHVQVGSAVSGISDVRKVVFQDGLNPVNINLKTDGNGIEYEPDIYNFNFGGYSGKFVITKDKQIILLRKEKLKITMLEGASPNFPGEKITWEITTPDGAIYLFSQIEYYINYSINSTKHVNSWYLKKITSPEGHQINLSYIVSNDVKTYPQGSISETTAQPFGNLCSDIDPTTGLGSTDAPKQRGPSRQVSVVNIDRIDFLNGYVKFNYGTRDDLLYDKKLTSIQIYKNNVGSQTLLKYFDFTYSYFDGALDNEGFGPTSDGSISKRLKLESITEKSASGIALPPYTFSYYEGNNNTDLPAKTSFAIDHWGYYNGKMSNTSLIPTFSIFESIDQLRKMYGQLTGIQRNSDPAYVSANSLKRITYPTGGYSEVEYEGNDYDLLTSQEKDNSFEGKGRTLQEWTSQLQFPMACKNHPNELPSCPNSTNPYQDIPIDLTGLYVSQGNTTAQVELRSFCLFGQTISCGAATNGGLVYFQIVKQSNPNAVIATFDMLSSNQCNPPDEFGCSDRQCSNGNMMGINYKNKIFLEPGQYFWRAYAKDGNDFTVTNFVTTFVYYKDVQTQNGTNSAIEQGGGQRVKRTIDFDGTNQKVTNFNYHYFVTNPDDVNNPIEKSYGRRMTRPQYTFAQDKYCVNNTIGGTTFKYGGTIHRTSNSMIPLNASASGAVVGYDRVEVTYGLNGENGKSIFYYENESDLVNYYGLYRTPTIASIPNQNNGNLIRQEDYRYDGLVEGKPVYTKLKESITDYSVNETPAQLWGAEARYLDVLSGGAVFQDRNHFFFYPALKSYYYYTKTNTERLFDTADFSKYTETKTENFYENPNHLQLTKKEIVTSSGQKRKFQYQYPLDLASGTNVYQQMVDAFIHSPVVTQNEYLESSLVNTQNTVFKKWFTPRNRPFGTSTINLPALFAPERIEIKVGTGALRTAIEFLTYDDYANLMQYKELNGQTNTLSYYTNHSSNTDAGKYNLLKTNSNDLSHISSYDFEPLVGLSTATDINNNIAKYEYDGFKRLETVKETKEVSPGVTSDFILKYLRYHYQTETTPTNLGASPSTSQNYVASLTPRTEQTSIDTDVEKTTIGLSFVDKLGKPNQTITWKGIPDKTKDIINSSTIYDAFGRESKSILATPSNIATGDYVSTSEALANTFHSDANAYVENIYEASPLNRTSQQFNSGADLRGSTPTPKKFFYESAGTDIPRYTVSGNNVIKGTSTFSANSLYKTRSVDEEGNETVEIKDNEGKLIQKQTKIGTNNYLTTHYVYNEFYQLKAIIQPEAYPLTADLAYTADHLFFNNYDDKGRVIVKKIPAAGLEYLVYDRWDRLVLQQSAMQRTSSKWTFFKYDALNRIIFSGEKVFSGKTHDDLQTDAMASTNRFEAYNGAGVTYYSVGTSYPSIDENADAIYQINYYDSYDDDTWTNGLGFDQAETSHKKAGAKGMLTGTKVFNQVTGNSWLRTANYYDYKNRLIQTHKQQHLATTPEVCSYEYNFAGETLIKKHKHQKPGNVLLKEIQSNTPDHLGRILINSHSIDDKPTNIANYTYDNISRLKTKLINSQNGGETKANGLWSSPSVWINGQLPTANSLVKIKHNINIPDGYKAYGATLEEFTGTTLSMGLNSYLYLNPNASPNPLQKIDFDYHVRGGILGVNLNSGSVSTALDNDLFSYKLAYKKDNNILSQSWKNSVANQDRSWTYGYDGASRLSSAAYSPGGSYTLSGITYDKNGNIKTLARNGIDDLKYDYIGNRLNYVKDDAANVDGFKDNSGGGTGQDYTFWDDGSLKSDRNKGIFQIDYDTYLKKVTKISFNSTFTDFVKFYYSGDGTLIRRESSIANNKWDYTDGVVYKNEVPYQMNTAEGRAVFNGTDWEYEFEYRDIWGNLRQSFKNNGGTVAPLQSADFDMLGLELNKTAIPQSNFYKYQKQERVEDFGLDIDVFKYRISDSKIGRFWSTDPVSAQYPHNSVYAFQENKFGLGVELEGKEVAPFEQMHARQVIEQNKKSMTTKQAQEYESRGTKTAMNFIGTSLSLGLAVATLPRLALAGAGIGGAVAGGTTAIEGGTAKDVAISTAGGATSGAIIGGGETTIAALGVGLIGKVSITAASGFLAGGSENFVEQGLKSGTINSGDVIRSSTSGLFFSILGGALGGITEKNILKVTTKVGVQQGTKDLATTGGKVAVEAITNKADDKVKSKININGN